MATSLNLEQRKALSSFFIGIAIAWFVGLFVAPKLSDAFDTLTITRYIVNIISTLYISLYLLRRKSL